MKDSEQTPLAAPEQDQEETGKGLGRRRLLKALLASGAAVALTGLPNKWNRPSVEAGELAPFADSSPISNDLQLVGSLRILRAQGAPTLNSYTAECNYKDPSESLEKANTTAYGSTACNPSIPTTVTSVTPERASQGVIGFSFSTSLCNLATTEFCVKISSNGRLSNQACGNLDSM